MVLDAGTTMSIVLVVAQVMVEVASKADFLEKKCHQ